MDYKKMLKEGRDKLPKSVFESARFEIPTVKGHIQGNKTIISNFKQISQTLAREEEHLLKYILKELATPGDLKKTGLILGAKIPALRINDKIKKYAQDFVLCPDCGKPDTKITKESGFSNIKCMACGARHPVKSKI